MTQFTRREFLRAGAAGTGVGVLGLSLGGGLAGCAAPLTADIAPTTRRRVVVIGGGWGGATAAKYVRMGDPSIEVILLEPNREFVSCPFSNLVLSGVRTIGSITFDYSGLRRHGVKVMHREATAIEPETPPREAVTPGNRLDGVRVVVVDDRADERELFRTILADRGAEVREAGDVVAALAMVLEFRPHVVVSDIAMPDEDGYVLLERLRKLEGALARVPAGAGTAPGRGGDRARRPRAGFDHCAAKPIEPRRLVDVVARLARPALA